jgi:mitochondrial chaperone BCS1
MIHCMAGELGLDVYIISLSRVGVDDSSLSELVNALPERCVALMEDIDAAFTHGVNRTEEAPAADGNPPKPAAPGAPAVASTSK